MRTPASAKLCALLDCRVPILSAGMGGPARSELVSAVAAAGGFGFLGMVREPVDLIRREVEAVRRDRHQRFGVNLIPFSTPPALLQEQIALCIELSVPVVCMFWDLDPAAIATLKQAGIRVAWQVGSVDEAVAAEQAGVDILIAQGREAGGHVRGTQRLGVLLPEVVDAVEVPVVAAGGLSSGVDLVTALSLGAAGVMLGTALLASRESFAHDYHKARLVKAEAGDTVLTHAFHVNWPPGAAVRVLKSAIDTSAAAHDPVVAHDDGRPIPRFSTDSPLRTTTGALEQMALYAGTGVGSVRAVESAGTVVRQIMDEAVASLENQEGAAEFASSVCYLADGPASGSVLTETIRKEVDEVGATLRTALRLHLRDLPDTPAAPPFDAIAHEYGRHALLLGAANMGSGTARETFSQAETALQERLERLLPQMGPSELQQQLLQLAGFLQRRVDTSDDG
ncbi:NAD(P)H-dependent flavin oxidoreductase [Devosia albogilva]|uniref:NAD(P)H-dependent flavin oxidoreductase n=1 Tax=Devosia albogilva TaxID=429726 RepID=A0ABW5QIQ2_9HYPH